MMGCSFCFFYFLGYNFGFGWGFNGGLALHFVRYPGMEVDIFRRWVLLPFSYFLLFCYAHTPVALHALWPIHACSCFIEDALA